MQDPYHQRVIFDARLAGCLVISLLIFFGCIVPFYFVAIAQTALTNLHLSGPAAVLVLLGIVFGSVINVPIARYPLDEELLVPVLETVGGWSVFPRYQKLRQEMVVSVNVGGCVVPVLLAAWLMQYIIEGGTVAMTVVAAGIALNIGVCYWQARPIPKMGISLPFFVPALTALLVTWLGFPVANRVWGGMELGQPGDHFLYAPVAFVIGVTGPIIGADLLHWRDFKKIGAGAVSIGGAGTWDGIVLSGLLAALLA